MSRKYITIALALALLLALWGCQREQGSTHLTAPDKDDFGVVLDPFKMVFDGRDFVDGETTFSWILRGPGNEPGHRDLAIELPTCAPEPVRISPAVNARVGFHSASEIHGVVWDLQTETDQDGARRYSITFPGDVALGEVRSALTENEGTSQSTLPGPCQGFEISGRVFIDADGDGVRSVTEELGIANVLIELTDDQGRRLAVVSDVTGDFRLHRFAGDYTLTIHLDETGYFNNHLPESFEPTTPLVQEITVGPDSPGNDFGFNTLVDEVVEDIVSGNLETDGYTREYWRQEMRLAAMGENYQRTWQGKTLLDLLMEVQSLALVDPFRFPPGREYEFAYTVLNPDPQNAYDSLLAELLATELNYSINRGIIEEDDLQLVLIGWGEALLVQSLDDPDRPAGGDGLGLPRSRATDYELFDAKRLFENINTGGGGGIDE